MSDLQKKIVLWEIWGIKDERVIELGKEMGY